MPATRQCEYSQCPRVSFHSIKAICVEIKAISPLLLVAHPSLTWFGSTYNNRNNYSKYQRKCLSAVTPPALVQLH